MSDLITAQLRLNSVEVMIEQPIQSSSRLTLDREDIIDVNSFINGPQSWPIDGGGGGFDPNTAFTYSLSLGRVCKASKNFGARNAYECGWYYGGVLPHVDRDR